MGLEGGVQCVEGFGGGEPVESLGGGGVLVFVVRVWWLAEG